MATASGSRIRTPDPLGDSLRRARHNHVPPLTQEDVADTLGVRQSTVSSWESGKARPNLATISELARLLGLDIASLVEAAATAASAS